MMNNFNLNKYIIFRYFISSANFSLILIVKVYYIFIFLMVLPIVDFIRIFSGNNKLTYSSTLYNFFVIITMSGMLFFLLFFAYYVFLLMINVKMRNFVRSHKFFTNYNRKIVHILFNRIR